MVKFYRTAGVALMALFLALPALALTQTTVDSRRLDVPVIESAAPTHDAPVSHGNALVWLMTAGLAMAGVAGTVSYAYKTPGSGTVPATAAQASQQSLQVVEITFADGDTTSTFTHNMGLGTTGASPNTGQDLPKITITPKTTGTAFPVYAVSWPDGNTVTIAKGSTAVGSGGVIVVYVERPHSIVGPK
jgi:hypothetical protein